LKGCREGWNKDKNGKCYQLSTSKKSWNDAECACNKLGTHLAEVQDRSYDQLLRRILQNPYPSNCQSGIWMGYKRTGNIADGTISWTDTTGQVLSYSNWLPTQPKNLDTQSCAQLLDIGLYGPFNDTFAYPASFVPGWADQNCNAKQYFVCQYEPGNQLEEITCSSGIQMFLSVSLFLLATIICH